MATVLGNQGTSLILQSREKEHTAHGVTVTETYRVDKDSASSVIGSYAFGDAHADEPASFLSSIREAFDRGEFSAVTLVYRPLSIELSGGITDPPGTVTRGGNAGVTEKPIEQHPSWAATWKDTKAGVTEYFEGEMSYRRTEVLEADDWDWTEANLTSGLNATGAPTDLLSATAANWLKISRVPEENGDTVILTEEWLYNADGWDTDIY